MLGAQLLLQCINNYNKNRNGHYLLHKCLSQMEIVCAVPAESVAYWIGMAASWWDNKNCYWEVEQTSLSVKHKPRSSGYVSIGWSWVECNTLFIIIYLNVSLFFNTSMFYTKETIQCNTITYSTYHNANVAVTTVPSLMTLKMEDILWKGGIIGWLVWHNKWTIMNNYLYLYHIHV